MIALLEGVVNVIDGEKVIINVNGVGYLVHCSASTLQNTLESEAIRLNIQTIYKENDVQLYGFSQGNEKSLFNTLINVQGVGCKHAMAILKIANAQAIISAIVSSDNHFLTKADGVGPKLASRIINELKDKLGKNLALNTMPINNNKASNQLIEDAITAMVSLGFSRVDATNKVNKAAANNNYALNDLVKASLKESA